MQSAAERDRIVGGLLAAACGDALGVHYEPDQRGPADGRPRMLGGGYGGYAIGEYSDDTQMAVVIARAAEGGSSDLRDEKVLDRIAYGFVHDWFGGGPGDVGAQTRTLLGLAAARLPVDAPTGTAALLRELGAELHARTGRTAGNGSLMRTGPVALVHLGDPGAIVDAARAVSALTHHDPVAGDACALWSLAIDRAIRTGEIDLRAGLPLVGPTEDWAARLDEAERRPPSDFAAASGWVVAALQQAAAAVHATRDAPNPLVAGVEAAINAGGDTDTVAAIAGALLGAAHGAGAIPSEWTDVVHGWPGDLRAADLSALALRL